TRALSPLSPYTTLFRSGLRARLHQLDSDRGDPGPGLALDLPSAGAADAPGWYRLLPPGARQPAVGADPGARLSRGEGGEAGGPRSEEHTSELQSRFDLV